MAVFMKGCEAIAEAAIRSGCRFYSGYPITPQSEIMEYISTRMPEVGGIFVQGESEVASINMVFGAACTGTRSMTSSSGPGISLKTEGISYMAGSRLPGVIVSAMRCGPGLGMIQPSQMDYNQAVKAPGHGGLRCIVIAPSTVQECVDYMPKAFDLADRDRNPVIMLVDGCICAIMEPVVLPDMLDINTLKKPDWALSGNKGREKRGIVSCTAEPDEWEKFNIAMDEMYKRWEREDAIVENYLVEDAEYVIASYGTSARICKSAIKTLRNEGIKVGMIRPITLYPFPKKPFEELDEERVKAVISVEMAIPAQMVEDVRLSVSRKIKVESFGRCGGVLVSDEEVSIFIKNTVMKGGDK